MKFEKISIREVIKKYLESKEVFNLYVKKDGSDFLKVHSIELNFEEDIIGVHTLEYYEGDRLIFDTDVQDTFYTMVEEGEAETKEIKVLEYMGRGYSKYHWIDGKFTVVFTDNLDEDDFNSLVRNITGTKVKSEWTYTSYNSFRNDNLFEDLMDYLIDNGEDLTEEQFKALFEEQEWEDIRKVFPILDEIEEG